MSQVIFKSNLNRAISEIEGKINGALNEMGKVGKQNIIKQTPVDTGVLRKGNKTDRPSKDTVRFKNEVPYAAHVEMGTYKMYAQPFMRTGLFNSLNRFKSIIMQRLKL